tara:strand:+ start:766 stop:1122 length:357 start_codon:yes stop_codon:yes gene_type:complete
MSTSTFIDQLAAGHAADAKETLSNLLSARAFESLDARKQELGATLFGGQVEEEVEELDELSKNTLKSYAHKATGDLNLTSHMRGSHMAHGEKDAAKAYDAPNVNRQRGLHKAINRLAK